MVHAFTIAIIYACTIAILCLYYSYDELVFCSSDICIYYTCSAYSIAMVYGYTVAVGYASNDMHVRIMNKVFAIIMTIVQPFSMHIMYASIVQACPMIIGHACSMITVHACTTITMHACTLIIVRTRSVMKAHSRIKSFDHRACMYHGHIMRM